MSDTYRRYRAIKQALMQFYQPHPTGHQERHLNTLVALICGLAGAQRAHLSSIADHAPSHGADQESLIMRFRRFLKNDKITTKAWFPARCQSLARQSRPAAAHPRDGWQCHWSRLCLLDAQCGLSWSCLAAGVDCGQRQERPLSPASHCDLLAQLQELIPAGADVTVLGDGEFDGTEFQAALRALKWKYVSRTAPNLLMTVEGQSFTIGAMAPERGDLLGVRPA